MSTIKPNLEFDVINAGIGDAFVIRYTDKKGGRRAILIDGGDGGRGDNEDDGGKKTKTAAKTPAKAPKSAKKNHLLPWLDKLKGQGYEELELLVVTHIDSDHIGGLLDFFRGDELPLRVKNLWFNWPVTGSVDKAGKAPAAWKKDPSIPMGLVENIRQAKDFISLAKKHGDMAINGPYFSYITTDVPKCRFNGVLDVTVLGPTKDDFSKQFMPFMSKALKATTAAQEKAIEKIQYKGGKADRDKKLINVVSIVLLFEYTPPSAKKPVRLLMTGDARDDLILGELESRNLLTPSFEVDLLKIPHHGSKNNNSPDFFKKIVPQYLILSTNGVRHKHPDAVTLTNIAQAYGNNKAFKLYHSVPVDECNQVVQDRIKKAKPIEPKPGEDGLTIVLYP